MRGTEMEYNHLPMGHVSYTSVYSSHSTMTSKLRLPVELTGTNCRIGDDDPASKLQRLMDQSIVDTAIQSAIESANANAPQTSQKRSHAESQETGTSQAMPEKPAKVAKKNAFAAMMKASSNIGKSTNTPVSFDDDLREFKAHMSIPAHQMEQVDHFRWGSWLSNFISQWLEKMILPHLRFAPHLQTKINALHVMIDIATAIAYAKAAGSITAKFISDTEIAQVLIGSMYKIVDKMSASETKQLKEEDGFIYKVKTLRQKPLLPLNCGTWNDLDEVLRVVKHPGPVHFNYLFSSIENGRAGSISTIRIRIIKNDLLPSIKPSTCFETKYNALILLVDLGGLYKRTGYRCDDRGLASDTIFKAISSVGAMMNEEEVARVVSELQRNPETSQPGWLNDFVISMDAFEDEQSLHLNFMDCYQPWLRSKRISGSKYDRCSLIRDLFTEISRFPVDNGMYGQKQLLIQLLHLRYSDLDEPNNSLSTVAKWVLDRYVPMQTEFFLDDVDQILQVSSQFMLDHFGITAHRGVKQVSKCIERNISRASQHATRGTTADVKLSAMHLLVELGLRIAEWNHISRPLWQRHTFHDHTLEDSLTDSLMFICSSLSKTDWIIVMNDHKFLDNIIELDVRRSLIPECLEGLDSVLGIVKDPEHSVVKASRPRKVIIDLENEENFIDLTGDCEKEENVIDLTDD